MNQQVKAGLHAVRDFLAGRSSDSKLEGAPDPATREVVAAELLAAMSGRKAGESSNTDAAQGSDTQEIPRLDANGENHQVASDATRSEDSTQSSTSAVPTQPTNEQEQERARKLFLEHGYFDEAVEKLGSAKSPAERVAAAKALGLFGSPRATAHLIAAMFDDDLGVRTAAEEALGQIGEPTVSTTSIDEGMNVERGHESQVSEPAVETPEFAPTRSMGGVSESEVNEVNEALHAAKPAGTEVTDEASQLLVEEQTIRSQIEQLGNQLVETAAAIKESVNEVQWRIEREGQLRTEAEERRLKEEELRRSVAEEAEKRRAQERDAFEAEQAARLKAESASERHAEEEVKLRLESARLRSAAEELARRRFDIETARLESEMVARETEATRLRNEAQLRHESAVNRLDNEKHALESATNEVAQQQASLTAAREKAESETLRLKEEQAAAEEAQRVEAERLRQEAESRNQQLEEELREQLEQLRLAGEAVANRRAEADASRMKADAEAERLLEAQSRMRAAEEARAQAEVERVRVEAEINQQLETQRGLLAEARRRGEAEQARAKEEIQRQKEAEDLRLAEVEAMKARAEEESKRLTEQVQHVLSQIESLRIADSETRRRIADAEVRRRGAEDAYRVVAEKVQRVEAEAHARVKEEERIIAKLEAERRTVAVEAQSRAEQEKRIKEEIEMFRRLEEQERPRIEEATLQLAAAEARLQERKERLRQEEETLASVTKQADEVGEYSSPQFEVGVGDEVIEVPLRPVEAERVQVASAFAAAPVIVEGANSVLETGDTPDPESPAVAPAVATYLNSIDPYKRAAAVAELARSGAPDAFGQIVECFDDHSPHVRNAAARAFRKLEPKHTVDLFNRSLEGASANRARNIGAAIAASGLAAEAIDHLVSENREDTYNALSILFVMAKTGETYPLVQAIEGHESVQVRMAAIKLLTLTGQAEIANSAAKRRLEKKPPELTI